ncbi:MAG: acyl-CoA dehydrogenase family protein, partial [Alphaproteobacteria bacterium]
MPRSAGALSAAEALYDAARRGVREMVVGPENRVDAKLVNRHQHAAHGLAWVATYVEALRQMLRWAQELEQAGKFGELEQLTLQIAFGEYLAQL